MKTIMKNLTGALVIAAAALGTAWPQSASHDLRLSDIEAKQPSREAILDSALCQRAREAPHQLINQPTPIDPKTRLPDLNSLMEKSDDVILALALRTAELVSPSGENPVTYVEVIVMRSWKGSHPAGDLLEGCRPAAEPATPWLSPRFM